MDIKRETSISIVDILIWRRTQSADGLEYDLHTTTLIIGNSTPGTYKMGTILRNYTCCILFNRGILLSVTHVAFACEQSI